MNSAHFRFCSVRWGGAGEEGMIGEVGTERSAFPGVQQSWVWKTARWCWALCGSLPMDGGVVIHLLTERTLPRGCTAVDELNQLSLVDLR